MDEAVFRELNQAGSNLGLDVLMVTLTVIGMTYVLVFVGPILWWRKHRELGFDVVVLIIISDIVVEVLKLLFMRERPNVVLENVNSLHWGPLTTATSLSFPSGHASRAFAMAALVALGTKHRVGLVAFALAALIGLSRIYLGLHWPSDVIAGAALGVVLAAVMYWAGKRDNAYTRARNKAVSWLRGLKNPESSSSQGQSS